MSFQLAQIKTFNRAYNSGKRLQRKLSSKNNSLKDEVTGNIHYDSYTCACGGSCPRCKSNTVIQPKLKIGTPGNRYEKEADSVADYIVKNKQNSYTNRISNSTIMPIVQRQEKKKKDDTEKYKESAKKVGEAFLETSLGKKIKDGAIKIGEDFISTLPGKIITGAAAAGIVTAIVAKNSELPIQIPEITLDSVAKGLSMQIKYEGPVRNPTGASITFKYVFGKGSEKKKTKQSDSEKYRAETARMAMELQKFREGLKSPKQKAEDERLWLEYWKMKSTDPLILLNIPGLKPKKASDILKPKEENKTLTPKMIDNSSQGRAVPPIVDESLSSSSRSLEPAVKNYMEEKFGYDFSKIKVHTGGNPDKSTKAINAKAYTVGNDIVFRNGMYSPHSIEGRYLLAHELTHTIQQSNGIKRIDRFSDDTHRIIEDAALELGSFANDIIEKVHEGNTSRDYSQVSPKLNFLLLCRPRSFGGYKDYEHFDNYIWDKELQNWRSRGSSGKGNIKTPINYISNELTLFVEMLPKTEAFIHIGNAFHTVEDFFAHSNFIELINNDYRFGKELLTGSVGGTDDTSVVKILESISNEETKPYYTNIASQSIAKDPPLSHAKIAKDYASNPYQLKAMVLAGLVIKNLAAELKVIKNLGSKKEKLAYLNKNILTKIKRYLRPPDPNDKWWNSLIASGGSEMESKISEVKAKTPVTANQCFLSPLRSIEAVKDSSMKLFGPTIPIKIRGRFFWINAGTGFSVSPPLTSPEIGGTETREIKGVKFGIQITGKF